MSVATELYLNNKFHFSKGVAVSVTASAGSATEAGYNIAWVQDMNQFEGWKGPNGTADFNILVDGLVNTWLNSSATGTIYWAVTYDARSSDQTLLRLKSDAADSSGGAFAEAVTTMALDTTGPGLSVATFSLSALRRYYKVQLLNSDRGGTNRTPLITSMYFGLLGSDVFLVDSSWPGISYGGGEITLIGNYADSFMVGGHTYPVKTGRPLQEFELNFLPQSPSMWETIRDDLDALAVNNSAFLVRFDGMKAYSRSDFVMVRVNAERWGSERRNVALHRSVLPLRTVAQPV